MNTRCNHSVHTKCSLCNPSYPYRRNEGPPAAPSTPFDVWFEAKHNGASFDSIHKFDCGKPSDYHGALSRALRAYVSEMVQE